VNIFGKAKLVFAEGDWTLPVSSGNWQKENVK
jgi:hypothetical protein